VAQLAYVLGCPFAADFSHHPFGTVLPLAANLAAPQEFAAASDGSALFTHMGDWSQVPDRAVLRDRLFHAMAAPATALRETGAVLIANIPHHRELARALNISEAGLVSLARFVYASFYSLVIDGARLGTFWPMAPLGGAPFRVGVHVRMGDMHIDAARKGPSRGDSRNANMEELRTALRLIGAQAQNLALGRPVVVFACADTADAREMVRAALAPLDVISSHTTPIHISYPTTFAERALVEETRSVVREHHTLATASVIFLASSSGFSKTACAIAGAVDPAALCFVRNGVAWESLTPGTGVYIT
jgi:hypothetical protein